MFGRRRSSFFVFVCAHCSHFFRASFQSENSSGSQCQDEKWEIHSLTHNKLTFFLFDMAAECVFELKCKMKESSKERAKKAMWWRFSFWCWFRDDRKKPTASLQFVGGEMGDGKMLIFERNDEKHSDACIKTYTYKCAYHTRNSSACGGGPAYSSHVCTASSAAAVTHFMWNWNEVESMSNLLCSFIVALMGLVVSLSLYSGSILI